MATIPVCVQNYILVELDKKFQDEVISDGGVKFYQDSSFRPEWNVSINGTVVSLPKKITIGDGNQYSLDPDRIRIDPIVKKGDKIIFSYLVVMNRDITDNVGDVFEREKPKDPYTTIWTNPYGLQIVRIYMNNDNYEVGLFDTKSGEWIDRIKGKERDIESFLDKYMPAEHHHFNYGNVLPFERKEYWKVDLSNVIAIKKENGTLEMVGDHVLVEPIHKPLGVTEQGVIETYEIKQSEDYQAIGKLVAIGVPLKGDPELHIKPNENIVIDDRYIQKYEIDGHDYWIVRQKHIYGKKSMTHEYKSDT